MSKHKARHEPHVRLYRHELNSAAYRSLCTDARALLVEFRALYNGDGNRVFMSRRQMEKRLGVGRRKAEHARDELIDRGFIRILTVGSFTRKRRHASVYALTNEPLENTPTAKPPKDYMRWAQKNTGYTVNHDGVHGVPRERPEEAEKPPDVVHGEPRQASNGGSDVVHGEPTDKLPRAEGKKAGMEATGYRCRNQLLLNVQCIICQVWITDDGQEFDGGRHTCNKVDKAAYWKRCNPAA